MVPAFFGVSLGRSCPWHCREHDGRIIADRCHGFKGHVAGAPDSPFVTLLHEDGADEPGNGGLVGEDADDVGAPLDLAVEAFDGVGRVQLGAMLSPRSSRYNRPIALIERKRASAP